LNLCFNTLCSSCGLHSLFRIFLSSSNCYRTQPDLLSFPTRRSSDLIENYIFEENINTYDIASFLNEDDLVLENFVSTSISDESLDRKSTRLKSSHVKISYAVFCLKKKLTTTPQS